MIWVDGAVSKGVPSKGSHINPMIYLCMSFMSLAHQVQQAGASANFNPSKNGQKASVMDPITSLHPMENHSLCIRKYVVKLHEITFWVSSNCMNF